MYNKNLGGDLAANYNMTNETRDELLARMGEMSASFINVEETVEEISGRIPAVPSKLGTGLFVLTATVGENQYGGRTVTYEWTNASNVSVEPDEPSDEPEE